MVVAGRAVPGARVDVLVDGDVVASTEADDSGSFAALGTVSAQDGARSLTLRSGEGVTAIASAEEIILAPVTPRAVARATEQSDDTANAAKGALVATAPPEDTTGTDAINSALPASRSDLKSDPETEEKKDVVAALTEDSDANPVAETKVESEVDAVTAGQADGVETSDRPQDVTENAPVAAPEPVKNEERASEDGQRIAVLRSDEDGVTLVPSEPVRPASVILDTISYGDDGAVRLAGRASADATEVRAYLDNVPVARMPIIDGGAWRGTVEGVEPGVYTLRIDAVDEEDTVTARIETPFKREAPATLAAAAASQSGPIRSVTVQAGDTLWAIARQRYGEGLLYVQVYDANRSAIRDPDLIYPGQVFELPVE
jgi:nucleoid-associated protein YgaU